jgi:hypothetical protein
MSSNLKDYAFFDLEITDSGMIREFGTLLNGSQFHGKKVNAQSVEEMGILFPMQKWWSATTLSLTTLNT